MQIVSKNRNLQVRFTRVLAFGLAAHHRRICNTLVGMAEHFEAQELLLPSLEPMAIYHRAGDEAMRQLYSARDPNTAQHLCLRPEGTVTCQLLAEREFKDKRDLKVFYVARCWRNESPEIGQLHEFTQFGVEVLNPRRPGDWPDLMQDLAERMLAVHTRKSSLVKLLRKYAYYTGEGFELHCEALGKQKVVCGGGPYANGYGFAFNVDRVLMLLDNGNNGQKK